MVNYFAGYTCVWLNVYEKDTVDWSLEAFRAHSTADDTCITRFLPVTITKTQPLTKLLMRYTSSFGLIGRINKSSMARNVTWIMSIKLQDLKYIKLHRGGQIYAKNRAILIRYLIDYTNISVVVLTRGKIKICTCNTSLTLLSRSNANLISNRKIFQYNLAGQ